MFINANSFLGVIFKLHAIELNDTRRTQYIEYCPEIKMLFPTLHSGKCFGAEPKSLECFKFLCEYGGMKCDRKDFQETEWTQITKKKAKKMKILMSSGPLE